MAKRAPGGDKVAILTNQIWKSKNQTFGKEEAEWRAVKPLTQVWKVLPRRRHNLPPTLKIMTRNFPKFSNFRKFRHFQTVQKSSVHSEKMQSFLHTCTLKKRFEIYVFISSMYSFSLDLTTIIVCPCHCLTTWLLFSGLDWSDSVCWRCRLKHVDVVVFVDVYIQECVYNRLVTAVSMAIAIHVWHQFENSVSTLTYSLQYCLSKLRLIFL